MLLIYTIIYILASIFYFLNLNYLASVIIIALALFLYIAEYKNEKRIINVRGLFGLGFLGGFGLSLLKLSKLSGNYSMLMMLAVFVSYFSLYFGVYIANKKKTNVKSTGNLKKKETKEYFGFDYREIILFVITGITFLSFIIEAIILGFVPLFTINTPHAYSTFHVFLLHYITTFYVFIPSLAICNIYFLKNIRARREILYSFLYVILMSFLLVSRSQLIFSVVISVFTFIIINGKKIFLYLSDKKFRIYIISAVILFIVLYILITINRAHNIEYLKGIFEMKNDKLPIFISQPYMYIAHNFENLNYMINNTFRWTFGRRSLYPLFTLLLIKKFFPIVVDSPYYFIKQELSTVTLIYDFYYDFGLVGVIIGCFLIGYFGKKLENRVYAILESKSFIKNAYILTIFALFCYFMLFSFFQAYFSLTETFVQFIILFILTLI